MPAEVIASQVSVFTLGGTAFVGVLQNAKLEWNITSQEGKGVNATDAYPVPTGRSLTITGQMGIASGGSAVLVGTANSSTPKVTFSATTAAGTYSGTAVISQIGHAFERDGLQLVDFTLASQGAVTTAT